LQRRPGSSTIGGIYQVGVVPIQLDVVLHFRLQGCSRGQVDRFVHEAVQVVAGAAVVIIRAGVRLANVGDHRFLRKNDEQSLGLFGVRFHGPQLVLGFFPGVSHLVIQPSELEFFPGAHVAGLVADGIQAVVHPGAGRHERPKAGAVLAAGGVVQVRQAQVVAIFVGEYTHPAVLRLDGVFADPVAAVANLDAAIQVERGAGAPNIAGEGIPAMAPDGPVVAGGRAGFVANPGMYRLEGIDVTIWFVEVAVAIVIIAIPYVELAQVLVDLRGGLACGNL